MRKLDPKGICDDFISEIEELQSFHRSMLNGNATKKEESVLAEVVFHRGYVALESFLSAWIIGSINKDSSTFLARREAKIRDLIRREPSLSEWDEQHFLYRVPKHIPADVARELVDAKGMNFTFGEFGKIKDKCRKILSYIYYEKIKKISTAQLRLLDAARAIRNHIAHQSPRSLEAMNAALGSLPSSPSYLPLKREQRQVISIGAYLKANTPSGSRSAVFMKEFVAVANLLR